MAPNEDLAERNGRVWRLACAGRTQEAIAAEVGISQQRVSQIVERIRGTLTPRTREDLVAEFTEQLNHLRAEAADLVDRAPPPAFYQGEALRDPTTEDLIEDHSGRLAAIKAVLDVQARACKMLGLDAPTKVQADTNVRYEVVGVDPQALT